MTDEPLHTSLPPWDDLIESIGPASLLAVINRRMGTRLMNRYTPEDVLQEALLHAWRSRDRFEWRGARAFRSWLLTVIDNRIRDLADLETAQKRGGNRAIMREADLGGASSVGLPEAMGTTTPSRIASYREQAEVMRVSVESLPPELRDVVWMRLFEQRPISEIAAQLGIGESAVRHRLRKGSELYQRRMLREFGTRSHSAGPESATHSDTDSSP
ncbi:MAG: sigma-70 family RNA polymerase sigma factor [Planctomycetes bacterium]|nr:sigma-70 family RNA polymerase sigma factor [Planctomycetota bacterium]NOG53065.1 sigma-70 family RNA polymerase sigma factor [Planctomycetota bacterium]